MAWELYIYKGNNATDSAEPEIRGQKNEL